MCLEAYGSGPPQADLVFYIWQTMFHIIIFKKVLFAPFFFSLHPYFLFLIFHKSVSNFYIYNSNSLNIKNIERENKEIANRISLIFNPTVIENKSFLFLN